jgi:hypothetical protein
MFGINRYTLLLIALIAAFLSGWYIGYALERKIRLAEIEKIETAAAEREAQSLQAAKAATDQAILERDTRINDLNSETERLRHALKTASRPCLSSDTRGVLEQSPAFRSSTMSEHSASPSSSTPASSANPGDSTDTDVAGWILDAGRLYEQCRARVDAIRKWDEIAHSGG